MAYPKEYRLQLGLSQAQFADIIGCNMGQLSMAECGLRKLPAKAQPAMMLIEKMLDKINVPEAVDFPTGKKASILAKKQLKKYGLQLRRQQLKATVLQQKLGQALLQLQFAKRFENTTLATTDEVAALRIKIMQRTAQKKEENCKAALLLLHCNIAGIAAQINFLNSSDNF